jgi:uncharacterized protein YhfF
MPSMSSKPDRKKNSCYLGHEQISWLKQGQKLTTCTPWQNLENIEPGINQKLIDSFGAKTFVYDPDEKCRGQTQLVAAFKTTFGQPSPTLVSGMGFNDDIQKFNAEYRQFWHQQHFNHLPLDDETILLVTEYEGWVE